MKFRSRIIFQVINNFILRSEYTDIDESADELFSLCHTLYFLL